MTDSRHAAGFDRKFTPVPRQRNRAGGWTADRQFAFLQALSRLPSVAAAARAVGMSARSAWRLRAAPGAEGFAEAWDDALEIGIQSAIDDTVIRATIGIERPIVRRGRLVGVERSYDNRALFAAVNAGQRVSAGLDRRLQEIEYRRECRDADRRLGPVDWDAPARAAAAEEAARPRRRRA